MLHPRYFNKFIAFLGVLSLFLILYFSLRYANSQRHEAVNIVRADSLITQRWFPRLPDGDSLQIADYHGKPVILDFWATWSERSQRELNVLEVLARQHDAVVIAAAVKDAGPYLDAFLDTTRLPYIFVDGTRHYQEFKLSGVPSRILFDRNGQPQFVLSGSSDMALTDSLLRSIP